MGKVQEGKEILKMVQTKYNIVPTSKHHTAYVDLLGRSGYLEEAERYVEALVKPDLPTLTSLLAACKKYTNVKIAMRAYQLAAKLNMQYAPLHVLYASILAQAGLWEESKAVWRAVKKEKIARIPGIAKTTSPEGNVVTFHMDTQDHPDIKAIHAIMARLLKKAKEIGYKPDLTCVTHAGTILHEYTWGWVVVVVVPCVQMIKISIDLEEAPKEDSLWRHSEKLAVAYGILKLSKTEKIKVIKVSWFLQYMHIHLHKHTCTQNTNTNTINRP